MIDPTKDFFIEYKNEWYILLNQTLETTSKLTIKSVKDGSVKTIPQTNITNSIPLVIVFNNMNKLLQALKGLVKINEQHNDAISDIIGHPIGWKDTYLDEARTAIEETTAMYDKS